MTSCALPIMVYQKGKKSSKTKKYISYWQFLMPKPKVKNSNKVNIKNYWKGEDFHLSNACNHGFAYQMNQQGHIYV